MGFVCLYLDRTVYRADRKALGSGIGKGPQDGIQTCVAASAVALYVGARVAASTVALYVGTRVAASTVALYVGALTTRLLAPTVILNDNMSEHYSFYCMFYQINGS